MVGRVDHRKRRKRKRRKRKKEGRKEWCGQAVW